MTIHNVDHDVLRIVIVVARRMGIKITEKSNCLIVEGPQNIDKINILIGVYPFFPTDLQQILTVILTKTTNSIIEDSIFPNRIAHLKELRKMQAYVYDYNHSIYIKKSILKCAKVQATDLRCAFALIIASCIFSPLSEFKTGKDGFI